MARRLKTFATKLRGPCWDMPRNKNLDAFHCVGHVNGIGVLPFGVPIFDPPHEFLKMVRVKVVKEDPAECLCIGGTLISSHFSALGRFVSENLCLR